MKVAITGANGFIGKNLVEFLNERNIHTLGFDIKKGKGIVHFDLVDNTIGIPVLNYTFDAVVHLAALNNIGLSFKNPHEYIRNNVMGFEGALRLALNSGAKKFIYASSSSLHGYPNICSPYSISKLMNEVRCMESSMTNKEITFIGLRFFNVFGKYQRKSGACLPLIPKLVSQMIKGEEVELRSPEETYRDFTHVINVCHAIYRCLIGLNINNNNFVWDVGCGENTSVLEAYYMVKELVCEKFNIKPKTIRFKKAELNKGEIQRSLAEISGISRFTNYKPKIGFKEGITRYINEEYEI